MENHTSGKWGYSRVWAKRTHGIDHKRVEEYSIAQDKRLGEIKGIAVVHSGFGEESEANARLIASAPELLEALELVKDSGFLPVGGDPETMVNKAIAKAKGGHDLI